MMNFDFVGPQLRARCVDWSPKVQIAFWDRQRDGTVHVGNAIHVTSHNDDGASIEPIVRLERDAAQQLMDDLWLCGIRPTEGAGSAGAMAATERHLRDMQHIAMGLLSKHIPQRVTGDDLSPAEIMRLSRRARGDNRD